MSLPAHNPIDAEWLVRGAPVDHCGSEHRPCSGCVAETPHELFIVMAGYTAGFGAPFFAKPFMKKASTRGKLGGTKGKVAQCTRCDSIWPVDNGGSDVLEAIGVGRDGAVHPSQVLDAANRAADAEQAALSRRDRATQDPESGQVPESRVPKSRD